MRTLTLPLTFALAALVLTSCATPPTATPATGAPGRAPTSTSSPWPATPVACEDQPGQVEAPSEVPLGVVRVSLCSEPGHEAGPRVAPPDALVLDPDAVVRVWNELAAPDPKDSLVCTAELGPAYRMVLEYPDGRVVQLAGELYGCRLVGGRHSAPGSIGGADQVLAAFSTALTAQRQTIPIEVDQPLQRPDCDTFGSWVTPVLGDLVGGYACSLPEGKPQRLAISEADWTVIAGDLTRNAKPVAQVTLPSCEKAPGPTLVGVAKTGETIQLHETCGWYQTFDGANSVAWQPDKEAATILDQLG